MTATDSFVGASVSGGIEADGANTSSYNVVMASVDAESRPDGSASVRDQGEAASDAGETVAVTVVTSPDSAQPVSDGTSGDSYTVVSATCSGSTASHTAESVADASVIASRTLKAVADTGGAVTDGTEAAADWSATVGGADEVVANWIGAASDGGNTGADGVDTGADDANIASRSSATSSRCG